jgi:hypothetical protein
MSIIVLLLVTLCVAMVLGAPRWRPSDVPVAVDRRILFDCLPGLILLQVHDFHLRAAQARPVERPAGLPVPGWRRLQERV